MKRSPTHWRFGPYELDAIERSLLRNNQPIRLTPRPFETLLVMVQNAGHLIDQETFIRSVWKDTTVENGNLAHNISVLRRLLGVDSDGSRYIETIPRHGYRFIAPVEASTACGTSSAKSRLNRAAIHSLAVLPLQSLSRDPEQEYFTEGMTETLIADLARVLPLRVISRTSVMQYKSTKMPLPKIAQELNVDGIIEGSVIRSGKRIRISVQLLHAPTDRHLWAATYERHLRDVLTLQMELSNAIASEISITLSSRRRRAAHTTHTGAYDAYLRGRYCWNLRTEDGLKKSINHYTDAIAKDPRYALAYSGLADSYALLGLRRLGAVNACEAISKARTAARKAIELDQTLAEAHLSLAFVKFHFDWDWKGADREFRQAIDLNPNSATSHYRYAMYLATMSRMSEAMMEIDRSSSLDPLSPIIATATGRLFHFQRKYDEAIEQHRKALALDPNFIEARFNLGLVYEQKEMFREAISEFRRAIRISGGASLWWAALGHALALAGERNHARRIRKQIEKLNALQRNVSPYDLAWICLGLGDIDATFDWMERALHERSSPLLYQNVEPALDALRPDPRFQSLLNRIGFPR
jgi:TolB-like protein/Tfp pilus assembly protein PilF